MTILVLRHETWEHLGHFESALADASISFKYQDLGQDYEDLGGIHGLIILGGPMSANDPELSGELTMIGSALEARLPMLGVCLGSQLIARALGARVYRNGALELGWEPVSLTEAGQKDRVLGGMPSPATVFHWHGETFDLPEGAEWLAWSQQTRHQAFRYGPNVYGLQFHPEVTPAMIEDWSAQPVNCGDVSTLAAPIDAHKIDQRELAAGILKAWVSGILVDG